MPDYILIDGDIVQFMPAFGAAVVTVQPGKLQGSGPATLNGKKVCVAGDETKVSVPGCPYISGAFSVPGVGTLKIMSLAPNQKALKTKSGKKPVLLKGANFIAQFQVATPAQMPPPASTPDPAPLYPGGSGSFTTTNTKFKGA